MEKKKKVIITKISLILFIAGLLIFLFASEAYSQNSESNCWDKIILRIDDGPSRKYTPQLLETLQELGVKNAVFNLIGDNIVNKDGTINYKVAKIISDIIYKYHYKVGNHTFSHPNLGLKKVRKYFENNLKKWEREIDDTQRAINQALKEVGKFPYQCKVFVCPGGPQNLTPTLKKVVIAKGLNPDKGWDIDSQDSNHNKRRLTPEEIAERIQEKTTELKGRRKVVLLIHDSKNWSQDLRTIDKILRGNNHEVIERRDKK